MQVVEQGESKETRHHHYEEKTEEIIWWKSGGWVHLLPVGARLLHSDVVDHGEVDVGVVGYTLYVTDPLDECDNAGQERAQTLSNKVPRQVGVLEHGHEGSEGHGGSTVHDGQEKGEAQQGSAMNASINLPHSVGIPEEYQQQGGQATDCDSNEDSRYLHVFPLGWEVVNDGEDQRSYIGKLDDHDQVGGEVVPFWDIKGYQQWELQQQPIDGHPGTRSEEQDEDYNWDTDPDGTPFLFSHIVYS